MHKLFMLPQFELIIEKENTKLSEESEKRTHFSRNVLGHVLGMQMFREFIRGTAGENVFKCWIEIERWRLTEGTIQQKTEMAHNIKITYLSDGSQCDLRTRGKRIAFEGLFYISSPFPNNPET